MRFFEFDSGTSDDKLVMVLRNYIGRAASKKANSRLNWNGLNQVLKASGYELGADYDTFKAIYDASPAIQQMVKDFNQDGIQLNVPGAPDDEREPTQGTGQTSQDAVDQMAASAAPKQLAAQA